MLNDTTSRPIELHIAYNLRHWVKVGEIEVMTVQGLKKKNLYDWREA